MRAAIEGASGIAVLVGGSSAGKTRACWEALSPLRDLPEPWRLWHPIDPSRPEAALRELGSIGPRTMVSLNEAQLYLDVSDSRTGDRVAAGLRELWDPSRGPVLVLATLWPQFWDTLTTRSLAGDSDPHARRGICSPVGTSRSRGHSPRTRCGPLSGSEDPRLPLAAVPTAYARALPPPSVFDGSGPSNPV